MVGTSAESASASGVLSGPLGVLLRRRRSDLLAVATQHGLSNVRVFGSVARGDDGPGSDVDLLVDLPAGMGLFGFGRVASEFEDLLGVPVDLVPARSLKPRLRLRVEAEAVPL